MTIPSTDHHRTDGTPEAFTWLIESGLTGVGVPISLGGTGGDRDEVLRQVIRVHRSHPEAAAALASHQCVIGALLTGGNLALREHHVPALALGQSAGIWPTSAIDDMLHRGAAAVHALQDGRDLRLTGPLGRVRVGDHKPIVLLCPVQWSTRHPPGLALLDGETDGLRFAAQVFGGDAVSDTKLASLDNVLFREQDLVDADAARISTMAELQALHSTVRRWLDRYTLTGPTGALR